MTRTRLAAGYDISRVLKGGWQLAGGHGKVDPSAALADMERFAEAGITTLDCADIYVGVEELIGRWLRIRAATAAAVQVHTKYVPDLDRLQTHSRGDVVRGVDRSLRRLGVDVLDLVQLHWWDYDALGYIDAALWLNELRTAGKIRHVGLTNFDPQRVAEIVAAGVPVVSQHKGFVYMYDWLGMKEVAVLEPKPGVEPTVSHLQGVLAALKSQPARIVVYAGYQDPRSSEWLGKNAGVTAVKLPFTVGGSERAKDLFGLFDDTIARLLAATAR